MKTKPLWICHPPRPSFYLEPQAVFSQKAAWRLQAALSQVFLSGAFSLKTKRVVSMLSGNYSVQDISSSYLLLKDTFLVVTIWVSPFAQLAILKLRNMLDKREDQCLMGWLVRGNYDFQKLVLSLSWPREQRKTWETWRTVINIECTAGLSLTVGGSRHTRTWCILFILTLIRTTGSLCISAFLTSLTPTECLHCESAKPVNNNLKQRHLSIYPSISQALWIS